MKVHITYEPTSDYFDLINNKILKILNDTPGIIDFTELKPISLRSFDRFNSTSNEYEESTSTSKFNFNYFNKLIEEYRTQNDDVNDDDFIVLLSEKNNDKNFASTFRNNNIYIRTTNWENYVDGKIEFIICQQIVENIFDSLIKIDVDNLKDDPNIHLFPTGCLNDLCKNKYHFILKIRTAYICDDCIDRYLETNTNTNILIHLQHILTHIRNEFNNFDRIPQQQIFDKVVLNKKSEIYIGTKLINLRPLPKALFILALTNPKGIPFFDFENDEVQNKLFNIYHKIYSEANKDSSRKLCDSIKNKGVYFRKEINTINNVLKSTLGDEIAKAYLLKGSGTHFRLNNLIDFESL